MKRLVIIGGGFVGATVARELEGEFHVTLIDSKDYFEFTPSILRTIVEPDHMKKVQLLHSHYLKKAVLIREEVEEITNFEEALGIKFTRYQKADAQSIEDHNTLLWAKKVLKTKPNREISEELKADVKTIFHQLSKEELIEKVLAYHLSQTKNTNSSN